MTLVLSKTKTGLPDREQERDRLIAALYRTDGKAEIVNGEIIEYMATGGIPGYVGDEILFAIRAYAKQAQRGYAVSSRCAFLVRLPNRHSFSPDAAYWTGKPPGMGLYDGAPLFVVEVLCENYEGFVDESEARNKRTDYFDAGTEVVWRVNPCSDTATVRKYTQASGADTPAQTFGKTDTADAEPALPGFAITVADLFPTTTDN